MSKKKKIEVYDFDGTVTKRDTLIEFIRYCFGTWHLIEALFFFSPLLILMKLKLADNGKTKEKLFGYFFHGMPLWRFNELCDEFGENKKEELLKEKVIDSIEMGKLIKLKIYIVTASIENWVIPFFYPSNADYAETENRKVEIVGTRPEVKDGVLTGKFSTPNCYGAEKVRRLKMAVPDLEENRSSYHILAFGDSRGDKEMIEYADKGYLAK